MKSAWRTGFHELFRGSDESITSLHVPGDLRGWPSWLTNVIKAIMPVCGIFEQTKWPSACVAIRDK